MKFMLATLLLSGSVFAYTSSPAGNEKVRDPAWTTETRDPASMEKIKSDKKIESDKKVEIPKIKN